MTPAKHSDRDILAVMAAGIANLLDTPEERVEAVQGTLQVDEVEARLLISHGRRLARAKRERAA